MRVVLWGDSVGAEQAGEVIGPGRLAGVVGAANRPSDWDDLDQKARRWNVPRLTQPFRRDENAFGAFADELRNLRANLFVVCSYSMILPGEWLTIPERGTINVHAALLPQYRGANVLNWVLVNGERETGATLHYIDEGIDTGDVIAQRSLPIEFEDTALSLRDKVARLWPPMLDQTLKTLSGGSCPRLRQDEAKAKHWPRRRPDDGRVDWRWPAERIYNLIRALVKPWPGAFFETAGGERVVLDAFVPLEKVRDMQRRFLATGKAGDR